MIHRKLYIIILSFVFMVIAINAFNIKKTEAPEPEINYQANKNNEEIQTKNNVEKYKITNRSIVKADNPLNKEKILLLTIDDGPGPRTKEIIEILKKHEAKAIFFVNGIRNKLYPDIIKYIDDEGFTVGNHSWSHTNLKQIEDFDVIKNEIAKTSNLIENETNKSPRFFRAPYGESNLEIRQFIKNSGMIFMDWSGTAKDWDRTSEEKDIFVSNVMSNIYSGSIILIHEHPWSVANLDALLTTIEENGYTYVDPEDIIE